MKKYLGTEGVHLTHCFQGENEHNCKYSDPHCPASKRYPEHEKLKLISNESQTIGEFIDWLRSEKEIQFCKWRDSEGRVRDGDYMPEGYYPESMDIEKTLAEYYKIDLNKIEKEKRQMLDELRKMNEK